MGNIGDKSFAKELARSIGSVIDQKVGNASAIDRYQAKVISVDTTEHTASVYIGGSTDASSGFKIRGMQFPSADDLVMVCIDGDDRWIESVVRPVGTGAYPSITLDWVNNQIDVTGTISGGGVMTDSSTNVLTNKTFDTAGAGNVLRVNGTQINAVTGTGAAVLASALTGTTFDLTGDVTVTAAGFTVGGANAYSVAVNNDGHSHTLGTSTTGNYVAGLTGGTGVTVSGTAGEGWSPSVAIGQAVATTSNVTFNNLTANGTTSLNGAVTLGNATTDVVRATNLYQTSVITQSFNPRMYNASGATPWRLFYDISSEKYKTNIVYSTDNDDILDVVPVSYHDIADFETNGEESPRQYGFLAEDMESNAEGKAFVVYNEDGTVQTIQYERLVVPLFSAMRKMRSRIDELEARLAALEAK
jgi:hypothetical protein